MARQRDYSQDDKESALATLAVLNFNFAKTSEYLCIPRSTLRKWHKTGVGITEEVAKGATKKKEVIQDTLISKIDGLIEKILEEIPYHLEDASAQQLVISFATLLDKKRLLLGEATERTEHTGTVALMTYEQLQQLPPDELVRRYREESGAGS